MVDSLDYMKLWFPYSQMGDEPKHFLIKKAKGVHLFLDNGSKLIDGISSWWSSIHGYNHPILNNALFNQASEFSHVMLGGLVHEPALKLSEKLIEITPSGLNHVFFSDSGSVGVEVALKMAIQYWANQGKFEKTKFISLKNGYHGDTFKAMEVGDDSDFQKAFGHVLDKGYFVNPPQGGFQAGAASIATEIEKLELILKKNHQSIAAFILEPIVQCAGGFIIYSPEYLNAAKFLCDKFDVLLIFDEVATGFGRTGKLFAAEHAQITPDIMVLGKALTAGYLGHAATLTTTKVFESFIGKEFGKAFMHGPTFMGNALACAIALKSIEIFEKEDYLQKIEIIENTINEQLSKLNDYNLLNTRCLGAIGVVEVKDSRMLKGFTQYAAENGVWLRPFGNYLYVMPPYIIEKSELEYVFQVIRNWFTHNNYQL